MQARTNKTTTTLPHAWSEPGLENSDATSAGRKLPATNTFLSLLGSSMSTLSSSLRMGDSGVLPLIKRNPRRIDATSTEIGVCSTSAACLGGRCWGVGVWGSEMTIVGSEGVAAESSTSAGLGTGVAVGSGTGGSATGFSGVSKEIRGGRGLAGWECCNLKRFGERGLGRDHFLDFR